MDALVAVDLGAAESTDRCGERGLRRVFAIRPRTRSHEDVTDPQMALRNYSAGVGPDDLLPDQTSDDIDTADDHDSADRDSWLREQVPPHHGD